MIDAKQHFPWIYDNDLDARREKVRRARFF